eukprot:s913_g25.t1
MARAIIGSANVDLKNIQAILSTLRDNGKGSVIPPAFEEYDASRGNVPDNAVKKWTDIGISPIAATSACFLGKKSPNRSEVDAISLLYQLLEMVQSPEELQMGAKKFVEKCATYMKTFVQFVSRENPKVRSFCAYECINGMGNMWEVIKNFHIPSPIKNEASFTVDNLRIILREFRARPFNGGDFRGVNLSRPADNTWLMATRKKDEMMDLSDPNQPIIISIRAIHKELHYFNFDPTWERETVRLLNAALEEWIMQTVGLGHAWRCHNQLEDAREIFDKLKLYAERVRSALHFTEEIMKNHGYNVLNVEEGNHEEIKKRNKLNYDYNLQVFAMSHVQGPMGHGVQHSWKQYLRRVAMHACLCFQLVGTEMIAEKSWSFSHLEWLRIYNAAVKKGGMLHQNFYLSVGSMMAMVGMNDDAKATSSKYLAAKRELRPGLGGTIVHQPDTAKDRDELAGQFRTGKTFLLTDLSGLCSVAILERRVNMLIKVGWHQFQEQGKVRWQLLCVVLDKDCLPIDDKLLAEYNLHTTDVLQTIENNGEVFIAPVAIRSPTAHSGKGGGFELDANKVYHPLTTHLANKFEYCYHVTDISNMVRIIEGGLQPGGEKGGQTHIFFNPFASWDERYESILGGKLTHLGPSELVTLISENYIPKEAGKVICPACLTETPTCLTICVKCTGSLISFGERTAPQQEADSPGEAGPGQQAGTSAEAKEDVNMDPDEIYRLVKETKAKNASEESEDVKMEEEGEATKGEDGKPSSSSKPATSPRKTAEEVQRERGEAEREQAEEDEKEAAKEAAADPLPLWAVRPLPGSMIHCNDIADNLDPVDSTARVIDNMIVQHLKARYRTRMPKVVLLLMAVEGTKVFCKIMKYLIQTGIAPDFVIKKLAEVNDAANEDKADVRREVTNFIRKSIAGAFGVRSYDSSG